jgi:hypothetical protein
MRDDSIPIFYRIIFEKHVFEEMLIKEGGLIFLDIMNKGKMYLVIHTPISYCSLPCISS